jgi:hypothetical protein
VKQRAKTAMLDDIAEVRSLSARTKLSMVTGTAPPASGVRACAVSLADSNGGAFHLPLSASGFGQ